MTPAEVKEKTKETYEKLQKLKRVKIGMGNYQDVMEAYQDMFGDIISCVHELAEDVEASLSKTTITVDIPVVK